MDIKFAILGFLSWKPFTGYDLKKLIGDSLVFYWSGNNNQIYTALVQLHKDGLVSNEVEHQEHLPSRKIYSLTEKGRQSLRDWVVSSPELPQVRNSFLVQLAWADLLSPAELDDLTKIYEYEIEMQLKMNKEKVRRKSLVNPSRSPRESYIWSMISENAIRYLETELVWIHELRENLPQE